MIGVFDSGIGGLTVLRELFRELPECGFVYLGDTARVPYGTKGADTIRRYAREGAEFLLARGARLLIVACNTMSAVASEDLRAAFPHVSIVEVVTPAVDAAIHATRSGRIGVIGTRATIASGVYGRMIADYPKSHDRENWDSARVVGQACPLLVPLVEEGWRDHPVTQAVVHEYLQPLRAAGIDTLILGCTHYPLLEPMIAQEMGDGVTIVNPARATARLVRMQLEQNPVLAATCRGSSRALHFTDLTPHTERIASEWLEWPVALEAATVP